MPIDKHYLSYLTFKNIESDLADNEEIDTSTVLIDSKLNTFNFYKTIISSADTAEEKLLTTKSEINENFDLSNNTLKILKNNAYIEMNNTLDMELNTDFSLSFYYKILNKSQLYSDCFFDSSISKSTIIPGISWISSYYNTPRQNYIILFGDKNKEKINTEEFYNSKGILYYPYYLDTPKQNHIEKLPYFANYDYESYKENTWIHILFTQSNLQIRSDGKFNITHTIFINGKKCGEYNSGPISAYPITNFINIKIGNWYSSTLLKYHSKPITNTNETIQDLNIEIEYDKFCLINKCLTPEDFTRDISLNKYLLERNDTYDLSASINKSIMDFSTNKQEIINTKLYGR